MPYRVCGGLQDNGSWCGPSRRRGGPITNAMWFTVGGGDGFVTQQDPTDPNIIYAESQGGAIGGSTTRRGRAAFLVKPQYRPRYDMYEDSVLIERGDTMAKQTPAQKQAHRRSSRAPAHRLDRARPALQLEHAVLHLAAQSVDDLHRRQSRAQVDEARRRSVPDLARSVDRSTR